MQADATKSHLITEDGIDIITEDGQKIEINQ